MTRAEYKAQSSAARNLNVARMIATPNGLYAVARRGVSPITAGWLRRESARTLAAQSLNIAAHERRNGWHVRGASRGKLVALARSYRLNGV